MTVEIDRQLRLPARVVRRVQKPAGTLKLLRISLQWNTTKVFVVMFRPRCHSRFRLLYTGPKWSEAFAAYTAQRKSLEP